MISEFPHLRRFELEKEIQNLRDEVARLRIECDDKFKQILTLRAEFGNKCREVVELCNEIERLKNERSFTRGD